jgi:hypothetical protein
MARWIALGITLLLMGSCSFTSPDAFRGIVAPIGVVIFSFVSLFLFIQDRVGNVTRAPVSALMDAETQQLLRKRAAQATARAAEVQQCGAANAQRDQSSEPSS